MAGGSLMFALGTALMLIMVCIGVLALSFPGGLCNRMRGGWYSVHGSYWFTHIMFRALEAGPTALFTGILVFNCSRYGLRRMLIVGMWLLVAYWATLMIGWGTYMSIGYDGEGFKSRTGVFDWALGRQEANWTCSFTTTPLPTSELEFSRCWRRSFVGMSLRGLQWTVPGHFGLVLLGYDPSLLFAGACMGAFYDFAFHLAKGEAWEKTSGMFEPGTPGGETMWGWFLWLVILLMALDHHVRTVNSRFGLMWFFGFKKRHWAAFHAWLIFLELLFLGSVIAYGAVRQSDMRNFAQSEFGLGCALLITLVGHLLVVYLARKARNGAFITVLQRYGVLAPRLDLENEFIDDDPLLPARSPKRQSYRANISMNSSGILSSDTCGPCPTWWSNSLARLAQGWPVEFAIVPLAWLARIFIYGTNIFVFVLFWIVAIENAHTPRSCDSCG